MRWVLITGFLVAYHALTRLSSALAQDDLAARQRTALKDIRETAADICYTIQQRGQQSESEIDGKVQAKVNWIAAKIIDLGFESTGKLKSREYQGVLQTELAAILKESANCRKDVFDKLMKTMLPTTPTEANPNPLFQKGTVLKTVAALHRPWNQNYTPVPSRRYSWLRLNPKILW